MATTRKTRAKRSAHWKKRFCDELAKSSNVAKACRAANCSPSAAYETRKTDAEFARKWMTALAQGYDMLEMDLLHRLRQGELTGGSPKKARRKYDNAVALRLLAAHRDAVQRQRAIDADAREDSLLASIDEKLSAMRRRELAAKALLRQRRDASGGGAGDEGN